MASFLYRCPRTGQSVQGFAADDLSTYSDNDYESVKCPACRQVHMVNPKTGRMLGYEDDEQGGLIGRLAS